MTKCLIYILYYALINIASKLKTQPSQNKKSENVDKNRIQFKYRSYIPRIFQRSNNYHPNSRRQLAVIKSKFGIRYETQRGIHATSLINVAKLAYQKEILQ